MHKNIYLLACGGHTVVSLTWCDKEELVLASSFPTWLMPCTESASFRATCSYRQKVLLFLCTTQNMTATEENAIAAVTTAVAVSQVQLLRKKLDCSPLALLSEVLFLGINPHKTGSKAWASVQHLATIISVSLPWISSCPWTRQRKTLTREPKQLIFRHSWQSLWFVQFSRKTSNNKGKNC